MNIFAGCLLECFQLHDLSAKNFVLTRGENSQKKTEKYILGANEDTESFFDHLSVLVETFRSEKDKNGIFNFQFRQFF